MVSFFFSSSLLVSGILSFGSPCRMCSQIALIRSWWRKDNHVKRAQKCMWTIERTKHRTHSEPLKDTNWSEYDNEPYYKLFSKKEHFFFSFFLIVSHLVTFVAIFSIHWNCGRNDMLVNFLLLLYRLLSFIFKPKRTSGYY